MENLDKKALKSGLWYTLSNFLTKGIVFLTTPIFVRIMSVSAFGQYSAFNTWQTLLLCILPLGLSSTINRANLDYPNELSGYMSSITVAGTAFTVAIYVIVVLFSNVFTKILRMDMIYIHIMFLYMMFQPALTNFLGMNHVQFQYKTATALSITSAVLSIVASILFSGSFENQTLGRVAGYNGVMLVFGVVLFIYILWKGRVVKWEYIRYALRLALPLLIHSVSMYLLGSSSKLVIQRICGDEAVAFYDIGFTCAVVISMLSNSVNEAMAPWLYRMLHAGENTKVKSVSRVYVAAFVYVTIGLLLLSPEIMLIIGGETYRQAQGVLMPIMAGCCCQFIYTLYVNIEGFLMKPSTISLGTFIAAIINLIACFIFVDLYGYEAAAYITMACYFLLLVFHYIAVRYFRYDWVYDNVFNWICAIGICVFAIIVRLTYISYLRLGLVGIYIAVSLVFIIKFREQLVQTIKSFLK